MTRTVYRGLLWLHPRDFRRGFAAEMLWIFDEAAAAEGKGRLLLDGAASLARQWLLRRGAWKALAAAGAALLQVLLILQLSPQTATTSGPVRWAMANQDFDFSRLLALLFVLLVFAAMALARGTRPRRGGIRRGR